MQVYQAAYCNQCGQAHITVDGVRQDHKALLCHAGTLARNCQHKDALQIEGSH